jgi:putative phosphoesterase
MANLDIPHDPSTVRRIGFLADTHSRRADGSDLPQQALDAFVGVDLIVHLGDIGQKGIVDRLSDVAPVLVPAGGDKGWVPTGAGKAEPRLVIETVGAKVGLTFNVSKPDKAITPTDTGLQFGDQPLADLLRKRFGRMVDVVAFGGTHRAWQEERDGVLFFNPGSPTLPVDSEGENDLGSVAVLDLSERAAKVHLIRLRTS